VVPTDGLCQLNVVPVVGRQSAAQLDPEAQLALCYRFLVMRYTIKPALIAFVQVTGLLVGPQGLEPCPPD
jgi:hypothetical protein